MAPPHDLATVRKPVHLRARPIARIRVGLRNFASSESLPGVCPDRQQQGALDAEHRGVGSCETRPLPRRPGLAGVRAALALAADRRDGSI